MAIGGMAPQAHHSISSVYDSSRRVSLEAAASLPISASRRARSGRAIAPGERQPRPCARPAAVPAQARPRRGRLLVRADRSKPKDWTLTNGPMLDDLEWDERRQRRRALFVPPDVCWEQSPGPGPRSGCRRSYQSRGRVRSRGSNTGGRGGRGRNRSNGYRRNRLGTSTAWSPSRIGRPAFFQ
jgi:hypothetical protein